MAPATLFNDSGRVLQFKGGTRRVNKLRDSDGNDVEVKGVTIKPDEEVSVNEAQCALLRTDPTFAAYLRGMGENGRPALLDRAGEFRDLLTGAAPAVRTMPVLAEVQPRTKKDRSVKIPAPQKVSTSTEVPQLFAPAATEAAPLASLVDLSEQDAITRVNACEDLKTLETWFGAEKRAPVHAAINARGSHLVALAQQNKQ